MVKLPWGRLLQEASTNVTTIPVQGEETVYTEALDIRLISDLALEYQLAGDVGQRKLSITFEQGDTAASLVALEGGSVINAELIDTDKHVVAVPKTSAKYGRIKLIGLSGNNQNTTITLRLTGISSH